MENPPLVTVATKKLMNLEPGKAQIKKCTFWKLHECNWGSVNLFLYDLT